MVSLSPRDLLDCGVWEGILLFICIGEIEQRAYLALVETLACLCEEMIAYLICLDLA